MAPSFSDFYKSFYHAKTYLPSVDLSDKGLAKHLLRNEDQATAAIAERLISVPDVQQVLSEPLSYDFDVIPKKSAVLQKNGFKLLSLKPNMQTGEITPFYSVVEHDELKGWIIKSGATRVQKDQFTLGPQNDLNEMAHFTEEESLLRIEMAMRVQRAAQEAQIDVVVPKKKLVAYANVDGVKETTRKYCVICEKVNVLSGQETIKAIKEMDAEHQREVARKMSIIVQKAALVDASFDNIRLTPDGKLAFIDTEPAGLMVAKKPGLRNKFFAPKGGSVEKSARIGLYTLMNQTTKESLGVQERVFDRHDCAPGFEGFHTEVKSHYAKAASPKLSKWKIALSVASLGLLPLINVIVALVKTKQTERVNDQLLAIDVPFLKEQDELRKKPEAEQARLAKEYQEKRTPFANKFFAYTEGVPYKSGFSF